MKLLGTPSLEALKRIASLQTLSAFCVTSCAVFFVFSFFLLGKKSKEVDNLLLPTLETEVFLLKKKKWAKLLCLCFFFFFFHFF